MALCLNLGPASAANLPEGPESEVEADALDQPRPATDQKSPVPVKPSKEPSARGLQLAVLVGIDVLGWAGYSYDTRVSLPDGQQLRYRGTAGAPGVMLSFGGAVTLPGALRRITLGASLTGGGLNSRKRPVIPAGVVTPFSQVNLQNQILNKYLYSPGWGPALSLYVDHDLGFLHESRVRAGYQFWRQTGSYTGAFEASGRSHALAGYDVRLESRSHLIRVSVNDYGSFQDPDSNTTTSHRSGRRVGIVRQWGVSIGTHRTIVIFAGIGPFWEIAR
ncbi:MAG: hypothetical protein QOJ99_1229 [Bryobacterales bacterium]|jgi:hypothetical protein|nr:hypothetical protein [Bryobacterales bacterium]